MSVLQFISSLVQSLGWPAAVVTAVFVLRGPIRRLLNRGNVKTLKAGPTGVEIEYFDSKLEDAKSELEASKSGTAGEAEDRKGVLPLEGEREHPPEASPMDPKPKPSVSRELSASPHSDLVSFTLEMEQLAAISPPAAILVGFSRLEDALRVAVDNVEPRRGPPLMGKRLGQAAETSGVFTKSQAAAYTDIASVRNIVSHEPSKYDLGVSRALSYVQIIGELLSIVNKHGRLQ